MEKMYTLIKAGLDAGFVPNVHAIGTKGVALMLDTYERLNNEGVDLTGFRVIHAQVIRPADFPRFKELGVIAEVNPYHISDDMRWMEERIGHERSKGAYAFQSILENGAMLSFGSDWPGTSAAEYHMHPKYLIHAAVNRTTLNHTPEGGWFPEQKISVHEALKAYTINNAFAAFEDDIRGSLKAGKLADITVCDLNLMEIDPRDILNMNVEMTIVDGKYRIFTEGCNGSPALSTSGRDVTWALMYPADVLAGIRGDIHAGGRRDLSPEWASIRHLHAAYDRRVGASLFGTREPLPEGQEDGADRLLGTSLSPLRIQSVPATRVSRTRARFSLCLAGKGPRPWSSQVQLPQTIQEGGLCHLIGGIPYSRGHPGKRLQPIRGLCSALLRCPFQGAGHLPCAKKKPFQANSEDPAHLGVVVDRGFPGRVVIPDPGVADPIIICLCQEPMELRQRHSVQIV